MYTANVKRILTLALVAASMGAQAQTQTQPRVRKQKPPEFAPVDSGPKWTTNSKSPLAIARSADAKVTSLRNMAAMFSMNYRIGPEMYGGVYGDIKIRNNKTFVIQYEEMHYPTNGDDVPTQKCDMRANGTYASITAKSIKKTKMPLSTFKVDASRSVNDWITGLPRYALAGIHAETPLTNLVRMASRPGSGFTVRSRTRSFPYSGRTITQSQILVERTQKEAARKGPIRIEVTIDNHFGVPASARVDAFEKGRLKIQTLWAMKWTFKKATFPNSDFAPPGN